VTWHCAICGRKQRTPALLLRDGLTFGPVCAKRLDLLPPRAPANPVSSMDRALRKLAGAGSEQAGQMALFDEVAA